MIGADTYRAVVAALDRKTVPLKEDVQVFFGNCAKLASVIPSRARLPPASFRGLRRGISVLQ